MKKEKYKVIQPLIAPSDANGRGITVHDTDDDGKPRTRENVTSSLIPVGATVELNPNAPYTAKWLKNDAIKIPEVERGVIEITADTTATALNDDFTKAELIAFVKKDPEKFDDVPVSAMNKSELIDVILDRCKP